MHVVHIICVCHELAESNYPQLAFCCGRRPDRTSPKEEAMGWNRLSRRFVTGVLAGLWALPSVSLADNWPQQQVRIVTGPLAAGSSIDATARVLAEELSN